LTGPQLANYAGDAGFKLTEEVAMYWVYFRGTHNGEWIEAANMKSAKWIFALKNNLHSLEYIAAKREKGSKEEILGRSY
jgi:hypothetical protein